MEKYIKYVPLCLFIAAIGKSLIHGTSWSDAPMLIILAGIAAFYEYKEQEALIKVLHKRCDAVDAHLTAIYKTQEEFKGYVSATKLGNLRSTANVK